MEESGRTEYRVVWRRDDNCGRRYKQYVRRENAERFVALLLDGESEDPQFDSRGYDSTGVADLLWVAIQSRWTAPWYVESKA